MLSNSFTIEELFFSSYLKSSLCGDMLRSVKNEMHRGHCCGVGSYFGPDQTKAKIRMESLMLKFHVTMLFHLLKSSHSLTWEIRIREQSCFPNSHDNEVPSALVLTKTSELVRDFAAARRKQRFHTLTHWHRHRLSWQDPQSSRNKTKN